ncbi:tetrapyrrole biosynthesis, uroporphyrinogen III synthase [Limtongia smithiae]|uniref:tetrapyrrole biosynthesis, uroporphyrinogen III synthase n=1 Tax=Limtongia smithiae TaxID=1125753 RepID=UPI0034CEB1A9
MAKRTLLFLKNAAPDAARDVYALALAAATSEATSSFLPVLTHAFVDTHGFATTTLTALAASPPDALIITSQRALDAVIAAFDVLSDSAVPAVIRTIPLYTVGPATAARVAAAGFTTIRGGADAGNGKTLASLIVNDYIHDRVVVNEGKEDYDNDAAAVHAPSRKVVFFTGETRRDVLPDTLRANGITCEEHVVYATTGVPNTGAQLSSLVTVLSSDNEAHELWVVFFSPTGSADIADTIASGAGNDRVIILTATIGPTTEEFLLRHGVTPNAVAPKPDPQSLITSILSAASI